MNRAISYQLLKSNDPFELHEQVQKMLAEGFDLQGTLVTSEYTQIGQWMTGLPAMCEYILVVADTLDEYSKQCGALIDQHWDFFYGPQRWGGKILQWMQREKPTPVMIEPVRERKHIVVHAEPLLRVHLIGGERPVPILGRDLITQG